MARNPIIYGLANEILIQKGAIPVDSEGNEIPENKKAITVSDIPDKDLLKNEFYGIYDLLKTGNITINEILNYLNLSWTENELKEFLITDKNIEVINDSPLKFKAKNSDNNQISLFDNWIFSNDFFYHDLKSVNYF